jgi:transposase InsO family protein
LIEAQRADFPVAVMCRVLGVSRSSVYARRQRPRWSRRVETNAHLEHEIRAIHHESRATYGSPRVFAELCFRGRTVGRHRVARIMRIGGLTARPRRRFRHTTDSSHTLPIAENVLARRFTAERPNERWVTDITYIWTQQGWLYLAVVLDLFSRRIVGWSMADHMRTDLVMTALTMALGTRQRPGDLLHHSDRGSQYASVRYRRALDEHSIIASMSRRGECYDNAVAESFFGTLKTELIHRQTWPTRASARSAIHDYVELFYNRKRRHSTLGYRTPAEFEADYDQAADAA